MPSMTQPAGADISGLDALLTAVAARARAAGVFGAVQVEPGRLRCHALASAAPAEYRIGADGGRLYVSLVTSDRWLSESIESDLMHTGDDLRELIEEELVEQGYPHPAPPYQHYRDDDRLFTFRTPLPIDPRDAASDEAVRVAGQFLLAYEACFRRLGDMEAGDE